MSSGSSVRCRSNRRCVSCSRGDVSVCPHSSSLLSAVASPLYLMRGAAIGVAPGRGNTLECPLKANAAQLRLTKLTRPGCSQNGSVHERNFRFIDVFVTSSEENYFAYRFRSMVTLAGLQVLPALHHFRCRHQAITGTFREGRASKCYERVTKIRKLQSRRKVLTAARSLSSL